MNKIIASIYSQLFFNEYKLDQQSHHYNCVSAQRISGNLDIERLNNSLVSFFSHNLLFGYHLSQENSELFWVKNTESVSMQLFDDRKSFDQFIQAR